MELLAREMKILKTIEKRSRIQQNDLLDIINAKSHVTVTKDVKKLISQNMIFGYKIGKYRFYELSPHQTFYRNLIIQIKNRIMQLREILKNIENEYIKYGSEVLHRIHKNFLIHNYDPIYFKMRINSIICDNMYDEMSMYRKNIIRNISKMENTTRVNLCGMSIKSINCIHIKCNQTYKKYTALMHDRNEKKISKKRFLMDKKIETLEHDYITLHKQLYIFEKYSTMHIKDNQYINEIGDNNHSHNNDHDIKKNQTSKLDDQQSCKFCEEILEVISYHGSPTRKFIINILCDKRGSMASNTVIKHIVDLIKEKTIYSFMQGKNIAYQLANDRTYINSKKEIDEKIKQWYTVLSKLEQKSEVCDIDVQRNILNNLNELFEMLQKFSRNISSKYTEYDEVLKHETEIHEMFITIYQKTNIKGLLKNVLSKCREIRDILYNINETSEYVFQSDKPIKYSNDNLNQLQNAKNDLKKLYYKKIGYNDLKIQKIFKDVFMYIDEMINMLSKKSLKNRNEFYKLFRNVDKLLGDIHTKNIDILSLENDLISLKTDTNKKHTINNKKFDELVERLIYLFKYSDHHKSIRKLIINCCKTT
ncbi:MAG: hypothetical protein K8823_30 [Cenarchaeum symbiont of Oopsacas minuta]|nr:hypothetical protein [Cenarchaeum symbiont of Oopsacas minuta]